MVGHQTGVLNSEHCPQFFKLYVPEHCSKQLRIPPAFIKYFEGCLPFKFILVTSAEKSWEVNMNKVDDDVYLTSGWEKFVQDNSLEFGDFLIFYYNGGPNFYVSMSGKNNCLKEIEAASDTSEKQPPHIQENKTSEKQPPHIQENKTSETGQQSSEARTISFEVKIHPSYMTRLHTTKEFYGSVKEYRPKAKLEHKGRTWDVRVAQDGERLQFRDGWSLFVKENCLTVGDVCHFKMTGIQSEFYLLNVLFSSVW